MFEFAYLPEGVRSPAPPSLPPGTSRWYRPYIPLRVSVAQGLTFRISRALLDTGSQDSVFRLAMAQAWGVTLAPATPHVLRWQGSIHSLRFGSVELRIDSPTQFCQWTAIAAFIPVQMRYPLLGINGFLEYFDATFRGEERVVELVPNPLFPGTIRLTT